MHLHKGIGYLFEGQNELGGFFDDVLSVASHVVAPLVTIPAQAVISAVSGGGSPMDAVNQAKAALSAAPPPITAAPAGSWTAEDERNAALQRLAAAKPANVSMEDYAAQLQQIAANRPAGMTNEQYKASLDAGAAKTQLQALAAGKPAGVSADEYAAQLRALAAAKPENLSQAEYIAKLQMAAALKPRIQARSTTDGNGDTGAAAVAAQVDKQLAPVLAKIAGLLQHAANQREATFEHNVIQNTAAYRKKVLDDLMRIAALLPAEHSQYIARRVGLLSGFM
jgi:hypothetical protein